MATDPESLLTGYKQFRDIGNDLLIGGLIAEVFISAAIAETRKYKWLAELLAGAIVLIGVGVEVRYGGYADEVERQIRQQSNHKIADLNTRARELSNAEAQARLAIVKAQKELAEAEERTAVTEQRLNLQTLQESPRKIDRKKFLAALKEAPNGLTINVWYKREDTEAYLFAVQIYQALRAAPNWKVEPIKAVRLEVSIPNQYAFSKEEPADIKFGGFGELALKCSGEPKENGYRRSDAARYSCFEPSPEREPRSKWFNQSIRHNRIC